MLEDWQVVVKFFQDTKQHIILDTILYAIKQKFKSVSFPVIAGNGFTTEHLNLLSNYFDWSIDWIFGETPTLTLILNKGDL